MNNNELSENLVETDVKSVNSESLNKMDVTLFNNYQTLNELGKKKFIKYLNDLASNSKYTDK